MSVRCPPAVAPLAPHLLAKSSSSHQLEIGVQQMSACACTEACGCRGGPAIAYELRIGVLMSPEKSRDERHAGGGRTAAMEHVSIIISWRVSISMTHQHGRGEPRLKGACPCE